MYVFINNENFYWFEFDIGVIMLLFYYFVVKMYLVVYLFG